ncbi:hypothetical protein KIMH_09250 [Bombiscardovia apis]|uniref:Uncharacterized protein n=2 Tax=Bombiscardovia apis TaxID=2932182 RepID=A0ABM8BD39_9BIFI|nr:hypothetical protein KIMH_09250 [Bombiscardovia apis]
MQATNRQICSLLEHNGMKAYYADANDLRSQEQAVKDAVARKVHAILIEGMALGDWNVTLNKARKAGVAVVLLGEGYQPQDTKLFAAQFTIDRDDPTAVPLGRALQTIIDDREHVRSQMVSLQDDMSQHEPQDQLEEQL